MVGWGWAEMTGQNASASRKALTWNDLFGDSGDEGNRSGKESPDPEAAVPQADASQAFDYDQKAEPSESQFLDKNPPPTGEAEDASTASGANLWSGLMNLFKPQAGKQPLPKSPRKTKKIYRRGQTMHHSHHHESEPESSRGNSQDSGVSDEQSGRPKGIVRGSSLYTNNSENGDVEAPPRTTFFESAGDLLNLLCLRESLSSTLVQDPEQFITIESTTLRIFHHLHPNDNEH